MIGERLTYWTFFTCGGSNVVAWISYLLCIDTFSDWYPTGQIPFILPVINMTILLLMTMLILILGRFIALDVRVYGGLGLQLLCLCGVPFLMYIDVSKASSYPFFLWTIVGCSLSSAVVQSSMYGMAAVFGKDYLQAMDAGKGLAGVVLVVLRLVTKGYAEEEHESSESALFWFFGTSCLVTILSLLLYRNLHEIPFAQPKLEEYHEQQLKASAPSKLSEWRRILPRNRVESEDDERPKVMEVLKVVSKPAGVTYFTFAVCISCFPGLTASVKSVTYDLGEWLPLLLVSAYNLGDLIGKSLPLYWSFLTLERLHYPMYMQIGFLPLFLLDVLHPIHDLYIIALVGFLGFSTGYVGTSALMMTPHLCTSRQSEMGGIICSLALILGLCTGSYIGLYIQHIFTL